MNDDLNTSTSSGCGYSEEIWHRVFTSKGEETNWWINLENGVSKHDKDMPKFYPLHVIAKLLGYNDPTPSEGNKS